LLASDPAWCKFTRDVHASPFDGRKNAQALGSDRARWLLLEVRRASGDCWA